MDFVDGSHVVVDLPPFIQIVLVLVVLDVLEVAVLLEQVDLLLCEEEVLLQLGVHQSMVAEHLHHFHQ